MDEQKALLQGMWRKAFKQDEPLEIPCKTTSNATRLRFALYNAVRGVREGKDKADELLLQATSNCSVAFSPKDKTVLVIQRKVMTEMMQTLAGILTNDQDLVKTADEVEVESSVELTLKKLREEVSADSSTFPELAQTRTTPYYTR